MDPVAEIALWTGLFVGMHFLLSSAPIRSSLVGLIGAQPFRGIYSLVAIGTFIPMMVAFGHNKHAGAMLWYLRGAPLIRGLTWVLMFAALILLVAGLINPNPGAIGAPSRNRPTGILGGIHQDRRKLQELGAPYREFLAATSFFPGAALISRRVEWSHADMPWTAVGVGITVAIVLVTLHPMMFGGSPLG